MRHQKYQHTMKNLWHQIKCDMINQQLSVLNFDQAIKTYSSRKPLSLQERMILISLIQHETKFQLQEKTAGKMIYNHLLVE